MFWARSFDKLHLSHTGPMKMKLYISVGAYFEVQSTALIYTMGGVSGSATGYMYMEPRPHISPSSRTV